MIQFYGTITILCINLFFFFQINQTGTFGRGGRTNIAVPAQGIVDIRNALSEVLEEYGSEEGL